MVQIGASSAEDKKAEDTREPNAANEKQSLNFNVVDISEETEVENAKEASIFVKFMKKLSEQKLGLKRMLILQKAQGQNKEKKSFRFLEKFAKLLETLYKGKFYGLNKFAQIKGISAQKTKKLRGSLFVLFKRVEEKTAPIIAVVKAKLVPFVAPFAAKVKEKVAPIMAFGKAKAACLFAKIKSKLLCSRVYKKLHKKFHNLFGSFAASPRKMKQATFAVGGLLVLVLIVLSLFNIIEAVKVGKKAYAIMVDDRQVVMVSNQKVANAILEGYFNDQGKLSDGREVYIKERIDIVETRTGGADCLKKEEAEDIFCAAVTPMVVATAIQVNNVNVVYVGSEKEANTVLDNLKKEFIPDDEDFTVVDVKFRENVEVVTAYVELNKLQTKQGALEYLLSTQNQEVETHTVKSGESLWTIARDYSTTVAALQEANPGVNPDALKLESELKLTKTVDIITIVTVIQKTQVNKIAYKTTYVTDRNLSAGVEKVTQQGKTGEEEVELQVVWENGKEVSSTRLSSVVLTAAVNKVITRGKAVTVASRSGSTGSGSGSIIWPIKGKITSRFGYRSRGYHTGIDIDGSTGDPIKAAAAGTVLYAGWCGNYGYFIKIDHGDGLQTAYAHLSKMYVSVGDTVNQGEKIAAMGNTGNSTGSHLHFEVLINGRQVNPLKYLP